MFKCFSSRKNNQKVLTFSKKETHAFSEWLKVCGMSNISIKNPRFKRVVYHLRLCVKKEGYLQKHINSSDYGKHSFLSMCSKLIYGC